MERQAAGFPVQREIPHARGWTTRARTWPEENSRPRMNFQDAAWGGGGVEKEPVGYLTV